MTINLVRGDIDQVAAFQPFVGQWTLNHAAMMGITLSKEDLDLACDMTVYEDGYGIMTLDGEALSFYLEEKDGGVHWVDTENISDLVTIDAEGWVHFSLTSDGVTLTLVMEPVAPVTPAVEAPDAAVNTGFEGSWRATGVSLLGMNLGIEDLSVGEVTLTITGDTAVLGMGDETAPCTVTYSGGNCIINGGVSDVTCILNEDGTMTLRIEEEGITMDFLMVREGEAPAAEAPVAAANTGFEGSWRATSVKALGMTFSIEDVGISALTLDFTGDTAMLGMNGEAAPCAVTYSGNTCIINDGVTEAPCTLNEDGTLTFKLEAEGITMDIIMVREGGAPAVEQPMVEQPTVEAPVAEVTMVECSFCGAEHAESESTAIGGMILCPSCNARFFD